MTTLSDALSRVGAGRALPAWPLLVAVAAGLAGAALAGLEGPWIAFILVAIFFAAVFIAAADAERLLVYGFVFSMQAHATYRLFYGRAGSDGIAFPLVVCTGAALAALWGLSGRLARTQLAGRLGRPIAAILATTFLSLLFTQERFVGLTEALTAVQLYFVYWLALNMVRSERDLERVLRVLFAALAVQSLVYFVQSALGTGFNLEGDVIAQDSLPRPGGTVSANPAGFASFVIPILLVVVARWLARDGRKAGYALLAVLGTAAVGLTFTRVAWAGYAFGCSFVLALGVRRNLVAARRGVWLAALGLLAALAFAPAMLDRLAREPIGASYAERAGLMRIAFEVIADNPLTGIGPGAYAHRYKAYVPDSVRDQWLYTVHNEYLRRAAETGIAGGIAFVWLLVAGLRLALRLARAPSFTVRTMALGWSAGLIAVAWQMYWVPWTGFEYNALLWFFLGLSEAAARLCPEAAGIQPSGSTEWRTGAGRRGGAPLNSSAPTSGPFPLHGR